MIIFILNTLLLAIKLLVYSLDTNEKLFIKLVLLVLLMVVLYIYHKYPKPLNDINAFTDYYQIHNKFDKLFSFFMIFLYITLFLGGIFYLRTLNSGKSLDLISLYQNLSYKILNTDLHINLLNISLIILTIIFYIITLSRIIKFFTKYFIKIHIYYSNLTDNWYQKYLLGKIAQYAYYNTWINLWLFEYKPGKIHSFSLFGFPVVYHLRVLPKSLHYILMLLVLYYDLRYNNWTLHYIYIIFPYVFIYDVYMRFCKAYANLNGLADDILNAYMYADKIIIISQDEVCLDGRFFEVKGLRACIWVYLRQGLNATLLREYLGEQEHLYYMTYYKDYKGKFREWKQRCNNAKQK